MASPQSSVVLAVQHLGKIYRLGRRREYQWLTAVDDVSFELHSGQTLGLVGESGSGKTTTAMIIAGLEHPTTGNVAVCGRSRTWGRITSGERRRRGREVQVVFQDPYSSLDPRQTAEDCIREIVRLHFSVSDREARLRTGQLLEQVGLSQTQGKLRPRSLSGGQRQRVAIARALAARPTILILDEALAALDVSVQAQVLNLLNDIRRDTDVSYLLITHNLAVVRQITDQLLVMYRGKILERGPTEQILDHPEHPYTRRLRDAVPRPGWTPSHRAAETCSPISNTDSSHDGFQPPAPKNRVRPNQLSTQ